MLRYASCGNGNPNPDGILRQILAVLLRRSSLRPALRRTAVGRTGRGNLRTGSAFRRRPFRPGKTIPLRQGDVLTESLHPDPHLFRFQIDPVSRRNADDHVGNRLGKRSGRRLLSEFREGKQKRQTQRKGRRSGRENRDPGSSFFVP